MSNPSAATGGIEASFAALNLNDPNLDPRIALQQQAEFYRTELAAQNQEYRRSLEQVVSVVRNETDTKTKSTAPERDFKPTAAKPPTFNGETFKKFAHEAQAIIDQYLHNAEEQARLYGFLADNEVSTFRIHRTYVDWVSTGLTGHAATTWRRLDQTVRHKMTWNEFRKWIFVEFTSPLTLQQAISSMDALRQIGSCTTYSQQFNELVNACLSSNVEYSAAHLCVKYRQGLKPKLRADRDLFDINDDLRHLQHEAERLDDFYWRTSKSIRDTTTSGNNSSSQPRRSFLPDRRNYVNEATPMEIDNLRVTPTRNNGSNKDRTLKLTDQEKAIYRANGWCTYCRSHDHDLAHCNHPKRRHTPTTPTTAATRLANVSTTTATSQPDSRDSPVGNSGQHARPL